jgi:protein kinase-like protein
MEGDETQIPESGQPQDQYLDPWIGQMLSGYHVIKRIGEGGMGIVYLARHQSLDRLAAVKFLGSHMIHDSSYVQRFFQEARAAATLNHPNLVGVYDAGMVGENVYYIVMEYVEGINLRQQVQQRGKMLVSEAIDYIRQAAVGLGYAHKRGIIHRDVKPDNLMLTIDGAVKIGDLGLAKLSTQEQDPNMTGSGTVLGTPYYISPEQIRGARSVDSRTDIYSLGGTFYHLLTAKIPYEGSSPAVIMAMHLNDPIPDPRKARPPLDADLCGIIQKMMEKKIEDRFQSMEEVERALIHYQMETAHPAKAVPPPVVIPEAPRKKKRPPAAPEPHGHWKAALMGFAAALAGIGFLAAVAFFLFRDRFTPQESSSAAEQTATPAVEEAQAPAESETPAAEESKNTEEEKPEPETAAEPTPEEKPAPPETVVSYDFSRTKSGYLPEGVQCFAVEAAGKNQKVGPGGIALLRGRSSWEIRHDSSSDVKDHLTLTTKSMVRLKGSLFGASFYLPPLKKDHSHQLVMKLRAAEESLKLVLILTPGPRPLESITAETDWKTFEVPIPDNGPQAPGTLNIGFRGSGRLDIGEVRIEAQK